MGATSSLCEMELCEDYVKGFQEVGKRSGITVDWNDK